jgi:polysaccharide export outer membrane protein
MRSVSLTHVLVTAVALAGCVPGQNMIDQTALQARTDAQKAHAPSAKAAFTPVPTAPALPPADASFVLGPDDLVRISVLNNAELNTVQPVRPDGKIAFFPAGDLQAAGRTVEQLRDEIVSRLRAPLARPYRLGIQDAVDIKIYGHDDLSTTQTIGPDGTISILPGGPVHAAGLTVDALREEVTRRVSSLVQSPIVNVSVSDYRSQPLFIADPLVNVVIEEINSRRVAVLGAVRTPGIIKLRTATTLLDAVSEVGGLSDDADLRQSLVLQDGQVLPVDLERLFKQGDVSQNIYLKPNASVLIGSTRFNAAYVIGEVQHAGKVTWDGTLTLLDAIGLAGGLSTNAKASHILVISGGIADPKLRLVDAAGVLYRGELQNNIALGRGDIVYVPTTELGTAERYFDFALKVFQPIVSAESGVVLGSAAVNVLRGAATTTGTSVNISQ